MDISTMSNFCILRSFNEDKASMVETLIPFVEYAIFEMNRRHLTRQELQKKILEKCDIDLPLITLDTILVYLKKHHLLITFENNSSIQLKDDYVLTSRTYLTEREDAERNVNQFINSFISFTDSKYKQEEVIQLLESLLECYLNELREEFLSSDDGKCENISSEFVRYVDHIKACDSANYHTFESIFYGFLIRNLIQSKSADKTSSTLPEIVLYVDSNYILRLLGYQEEANCTATKELHKLISQSKLKLKVLDETLKEAQAAISSGLSSYIRNNEQFTAIYGNNLQYIDGVVGSFFRREVMSIPQVQAEIANLKKRLLSEDVGYDNSIIANIVVSENILEALVKRKLKKENKNQRNGNYEKFEKIVNENAKTDLQIISKIRSLRGGRKYDFANCQYLFLTCDNTLYEFNRYSHGESRTVPECINEKLLANTLFMMNPQNINSASLQLFISVLKSSSYVKLDSIKRFHEYLLDYIKKNPSDEEYLNDLFNNQTLFNSIKDFGEVDEDSADARIAGILLEVKRKRTNDTDTHKDLDNTHDDLRKENEELRLQLAERNEYISQLLATDTEEDKSTPEQVKQQDPKNTVIIEQTGSEEDQNIGQIAEKTIFCLFVIIITLAFASAALILGYFSILSLSRIGNYWQDIILIYTTAFCALVPIMAIRKKRLRIIVKNLLSKRRKVSTVSLVFTIIWKSATAALVTIIIPICINVISPKIQ